MTKEAVNSRKSTLNTLSNRMSHQVIRNEDEPVGKPTKESNVHRNLLNMFSNKSSSIERKHVLSNSRVGKSSQVPRKASIRSDKSNFQLFNIYENAKTLWKKNSRDSKLYAANALDDKEKDLALVSLIEKTSFDTDVSDGYTPSPHLGKRLSNPFLRAHMTDKGKGSFQFRNDAFRTDIDRIARNNRLKVKANTKNTELSEREANFNIFKRVNLLRHRDNIFKAAEKIAMDLPPFPTWSYKNKHHENLDIVTINVGGKKFEVFDDTLMNIPHAKLSDCYVAHSGDPYLYFDRDPACFNYVINFFRTGRLHAPTNTCLTFFEDELQFWGINEDLMEPCCYSEYMAYKKTCDTLKRYTDTKDERDASKEKMYSFESIREKLYLISTSADNGVLGRWYSLLLGTAIILAIITMIVSTSPDGRVSKTTGEYSERVPTESLTTFFGRTDVNPSLNLLEMILVGFFIADLFTRFTMSSQRLVFFSDTINWIDFIATLSSLLSNLSRSKVQPGEYEAYILLLKIPRVLRLFRLTKTLKSGMDALVLTLIARSSELKMVLILTLIAVSMYGALIYVVELLNETEKHKSSFKSVYDGMWFAIVTMATVGYGDLVPKSSSGYIVGFFCILTGIIISQLPVPIFLNNFANFYTQIQSRQREVNKVLNENIDPENFVARGPKKKTLDEAFKQDEVTKIKFSIPD